MEDSTMPLFTLQAPESDCSKNMSFKPTTVHVELPISVRETFDKISTALNHQSDLERDIDEVLTGMREGTASFKDVESTLSQCKGKLAGIRQFLTTCVKSIPITLRPTAESAVKACQVFETAELIELILTNLDAEDLLSALQINRVTSHMISTSPSLQDVLHLRPAKDGFGNTLFDYSKYPCSRTFFRPFYVKMLDHSTLWSSEWDVDLEFIPPRLRELRIVATFVSRHDIPTVSNLCRRMLVCQPPVLTMRVNVNCCCVPHTNLFGVRIDTCSLEKGLTEVSVHGKPLTITSASGLTVGNIYDAFLKIRAHHRHCVQSCVKQHTADRIHDVDVTFTADVVMKPDDPNVLRIFKEMITVWLGTIARSERQRKASIYKRAKELALGSGCVIGTREEFEAEYADALDANGKVAQ